MTKNDLTEKLTLQTAAAFERLNESLLGKTEDDLDQLLHELEKLLKKANEIREISICFISGNC